MDAKLTWRGRLSFTGTSDSSFSLPLGSDPSAGGDNDGFRPMELILLGLAGCTAMDVISILTKKRQQVTDFEVQAHATRAETPPKVFTGAEIEYRVTGHGVDETALLRSIELSAETYCPAHAMLSKTMPIVLKYSIFEEQGEGERSLVKSGQYMPTLAGA